MQFNTHDYKRMRQKITLKRIYKLLQTKTMQARINLDKADRSDFEFTCGYWLMGDLAVRLIEMVLREQEKLK